MEKRVLFRSAWLPWLLLAPQVVVIAVFFFWPAAQALLQSFQLQDAFGLHTQWVGLDNFRTLFADSGYLRSFRITALFAALVTVSGLALALLFAVFADRIVRGVLAFALLRLGLHWNYLLDTGDAIALIVIASVWKQISYNFLFFLAGLQAIPKSLIEAAAIDGAGPWRRFLSVQFPLLSPTTFFLLVINMVYAFFDTFAIIVATTQGGPGQDTMVLVYKVYNDGFLNNDLGGSAAQSVVLMVIVIALTEIGRAHV